jgi:hypothetical protein
MAGTTDYTDEQKQGFLVLAQKQGRGPAAKKAKVTTQTIAHWAKKFGVDLKAQHPDAPKKGKKRRKARANGKANGHAPLLPRTSGELEAVEQQLTTALQGVQKMRHAFRQVFG